MIYEFEGKTEKEAIDAAAESLGLKRDQFDIEILESQKTGLFKKGWVKIRVHVDGDTVPKNDESVSQAKPAVQESPARTRPVSPPRSQSEIDDFEAKIIAFVSTMLDKMDFPNKVNVLFREEGKLGIRIESEYSAIIIGKKGKNLDSLQLLANVYAGRIGFDDMRIILDSENYRIRREEALVRLAYETAEKVRASRQSVLLEPMNPFERRLIHTTLSDIGDIETKSEGEGLYKQVRIFVRGRSY
jgi:spoIIIJ-associated protein